MNASPATNPIETIAPLALWRVAEAFMHILHALFGDPSEAATKHTLTLKAHQFMAAWLRCGEAMMRRLLLIEAAAFAKPNTRPLLRITRPRKGKAMQFSPETPEHWRVSFRCFASHTLRRAQCDAVCVSENSASGPVSISLSLSKAERPRPFVYREDRGFRPRSDEVRPERRTETRTNRKHCKPILRQDREWIKHEPPLAFRSAWPLAERYEALLRAFNAPLDHASRLARQLHATPHRLCEILRAPPEAHARVDQFPALTEAARRHGLLFNSG